MNKKTLNKVVLFSLINLIVLLIVSLFASNVYADVGGQVSHSSSSSSYSGSSSGGSNAILILPYPLNIIVIVLFLAYVVYTKYINPSEDDSSSQPFVPKNEGSTQMSITETQELNAIADIQAVDPMFDEELFKAWAEEVFITLQEAWTNKNWQAIRPFESNELFNQHNKQLEQLIASHQTNVIERVAVKDVRIKSFENKGSNETVKVQLLATMRDYYVDDDSGKVIEGRKDEEFKVLYELKFIRTAGVKTSDLSTKSVTNCPNCGAPTEITSSGQCPYCKSVITTGDYTFVLASLKSLGQTSARVR